MKSDAVKKGMQTAPQRSLFNALGMTKEEQENLFQPFIREESGNHLKRFSNSLGLFVSKHVIDEIGGKIDVESARNQGTKVTVQFCLQRANAS